MQAQSWLNQAMAQDDYTQSASSVYIIHKLCYLQPFTLSVVAKQFQQSTATTEAGGPHSM